MSVQLGATDIYLDYLNLRITLRIGIRNENKMTLKKRHSYNFDARTDAITDFKGIPLEEVYGQVDYVEDAYVSKVNSNLQGYEEAVVNQTHWVQNNALTIARNSIANWSLLKIKAIQFTILDDFNVQANIDNAIVAEGGIHSITVRPCVIEEPLHHSVTLKKCEMTVALFLSEELGLKDALEKLYDFWLFLIIRKDTRITPYKIKLQTTIGIQLDHLATDHSISIEGNHSIEPFEIVIKNIGLQYKNWIQLYTTPLWEEQSAVVGPDLWMHYNTAIQDITTKFSYLEETSNQMRTDPRTWFGHVFDYFEVILRSLFILNGMAEGRTTAATQHLIEAYIGSYSINNKVSRKELPQKARLKTAEMFPNFEARLLDAAAIRNRQHHTYLSKKPNLERIKPFDDVMTMLKLTQMLWTTAWSILMIDIIGIKSEYVQNSWPIFLSDFDSTFK